MTSSSFITLNLNWPQLACYGSSAICAYYSAKQGGKLLKNTLNIFIGSASLNERVKGVMDSNLPLYHKSKNLLVGSENFTGRFNHLGKALLNLSFGVLSGIAAFILFDMGLQMNTPYIKTPPSPQDIANRLKEQNQLLEVANKIEELKRLKALISHLSFIEQNQPIQFSDHFPTKLKQQFDQIFDKILTHYCNSWTTQLPKEIQEMLSFDKDSLSNNRITHAKNDALIRNTIFQSDGPLGEETKDSPPAEHSSENISPSLNINQFDAFKEHIKVLVMNDKKYRAQDLANQEEALSTPLGPITVRLHKACDYFKDSFDNPSQYSYSWASSALSERCKPYLEAKKPTFSKKILGNLNALLAERRLNENNQPFADEIAKMALVDSNVEIQEYLAQIRNILKSDHEDMSEALEGLVTSNPEVCVIQSDLTECSQRP